MTIDYDRMKRTMPKHKSALTRAKKSGDAGKVVRACEAAVKEWDAIGAWPDQWHTWQVALSDVAPQVGYLTLQDL